MKFYLANNYELFEMLDLNLKIINSNEIENEEQIKFLNKKIDELEIEIAKRNILDDWKNFLNNKYNVNLDRMNPQTYLDFLDEISGKKTFLI